MVDPRSHAQANEEQGSRSSAALTARRFNIPYRGTQLGSRFATMSTDRYRHLREGHQESDHEQRKSQRPRQPPDKSREPDQDETHDSEYPPLVY